MLDIEAEEKGEMRWETLVYQIIRIGNCVCKELRKWIWEGSFINLTQIELRRLRRTGRHGLRSGPCNELLVETQKLHPRRGNQFA